MLVRTGEWAEPHSFLMLRGGERVRSGAGRGRIVSAAEEVAEQVAAEQDVEIVDVEYVKEGGNFILRIYIDKVDGVGLDDCQAFSVSFSEIFDEIDPIPGSYSLEVSSPGIERPLKRLRDFERFSGHLVQVRTYAPVEGRKRWKGRLEGVSGDSIVVHTQEETVAVPLEMVSSARLVADFSENLGQGAKRR